MDRKNLARTLLLTTVVAAISLESTWITIHEEFAGVSKEINRNGEVTMPILVPLIALNLVSTLALFLLPRLAQRFTLGLTAVMAGTATFMTIGWSLNHSIKIAPILGVLASLASLYLTGRATFSTLAAPRGPQEKAERDRWRALDEGIDPTIDE